MASYRLTYIVFILLIFIAIQISFAQAQQTTGSTHVQRCESYKSEVYEKVLRTSCSLFGGAPGIVFRIDNCKQPTPFIIGGTPAKPKEFPHMARLGFAQKDQETNWFCGGTLISNQYVLTAAHCFYARERKVNIVRLGELVFNSEADDAQPEDFEVADYTAHPNYHIGAAYDDIGLVKLKRLVTFSEYIAPSCLPTKDGNDYSQFLAVGWGATNFSEKRSVPLLKVTLDRIDDQKCKEHVDVAQRDRLSNGLNSKTHMCAGSKERKDTCFGDSGGPLLQIHDNYPCMYSVYGITSFDFSCENSDTPGVYTRVYNYVDWIEKIAF